MKRDSLILAAVILIFGLFAWAGWTNYEFRKMAAKRSSAQAAQTQAAQAQAAQSLASNLPQSAAALLGKPAPAFTLNEISGRKIALADYKGKAVLINFWATWCGPCKIETPWLIELRKQYAAQGFEILGVSMDDLDSHNAEVFSGQKREIAAFVRQSQIPYPVLLDGDAISQPYGGLDDLPTSFFVNRQGVVVATVVGLVSKDEIEGNIRKALGGGK